MLEVVVHRHVETLDRAGQVHGAGVVQQLVDRGVRVVVGAEHGAGLGGVVGAIHLLDGHRGQNDAFQITQRDHVALGDALGEGLADIQRDGHGPQGAVGEAHVGEDRIVVLLAEESFEGRKAAVQQQFRIADLPRAQVERRVVARALLFLGKRLVLQIQVLQFAPVGLDQFGHGFSLL